MEGTEERDLPSRRAWQGRVRPEQCLLLSVVAASNSVSKPRNRVLALKAVVEATLGKEGDGWPGDAEERQ